MRIWTRTTMALRAIICQNNNMPEKDTKVLSDSLSAEAVQAHAVAQEATEKAREAQMEAVVERVLIKVLSNDEGSPLLIKRIPLICNDIKAIQISMTDMRNDTKWAKIIVSISAGFGSVVGLPVLGWLILQVIHNTTSIAILLHATH